MTLEQGRYGMIGTSPAMVKVYDAVNRVCNSKSTVYIAGESGTGKELVAKALHEQGRRRGNSFVAVNVNEFGDDALLEANLFGVESRVATGVSRREGIFVQADNGTLFLDEIAEMSPAMQAKLLRVIQEGKVVPVGGDYSTPTSFDVRLVAASSKPLEEYVKAGDFRSDLYFRLRVIYVQLPPLRERGDDVCLLADHFLQKYNAEEEKHVRFHESVYPWLNEQSWPGNVRELENTIRGAVAWTRKEELQPKDFLVYRLERGETAFLSPESTSLTGVDFLKTYFSVNTDDRDRVKRELEALLGECGGSAARVAKLIGIGRTRLLYQLNKRGIDPARFRKRPV